MKKLMASTIIILPLLLLAILLVSGAILSLFTHIYVETVEFSQKDAIIIVMDDVNNPEPYDVSKEITVLPLKAENRDLIYESENEEVATVSENGIITPVFYGETTITVSSRENTAAKTERKIVITGSKVQNLTFNDGYKTTLNIGESTQLFAEIKPVDALNKKLTWTSSDDSVLNVSANGTVTAVGAGSATITAASAENDEIKVTSQTITCQAQSGFNVYCAGKPVENNKTYKTFLDNLTFETLTSDNVTYSVNGNTQTVANGKVTISTQNVSTISFTSNGKTINFHVEKENLQNYCLKVFATLASNSGENTVLNTIEDASEDFDVYLTKNVQDCLTMEVQLGENNLGGFGNDETFKDLFKIDLGDTEGWETDYDYLTNQITLSFAALHGFSQQLQLKVGGNTTNIELNRSYISQIEFTNFDSEIDNYAGYQQVRVFAKHSYYDGNSVDYFKIPLKAFRDLAKGESASSDSITWTLSRYVGDEVDKELASQVGYTVNYDGKTYTIEQDGDEYVLKDAQNEIVSGKGGKNDADIIWVDAFTEPGYARIYFGDFAGLSEVDVQNDYFGNFDERDGWTRPTEQAKDESGREFGISDETSFAFLRVEAGDGATDGVNCHFNFNVLNDDSLINVFNANGYYQNENVVLQSDLYGAGELGDSGEKFETAKKNDLFLTEVEGLGKTTIYGNGYQVNFEAKNASMAQYSEGDGITVQKAYNTVIKCSNPVDTISAKNQKMVLKMNYAYYCELTYYYKFNPAGNAFYTKNTVFAYVPKAAIQLSNNEPLYAENITMVECGVGVLLDNSSKHDSKMYFKGNVDILDFANKSGLENLNPLVGMLYAEVVKNVKDYLEWQGGETFTVNSNSTAANSNADKVYVNVLMFAVGNISGNVFVWKDDGYVKAEEATLSNGAKLVNKNLAWNMCYAWTYEILDENGQRLDDATVDLTGYNVTVTADLSKFFTDNRYIRLQCEYKSEGVKNYDHILWHMQQVYRDKSLIGHRIHDHVEALRESLKGVTWGDGSGVDADGNIYESVAEINEMLSTAITPKKDVA